MLPCSPVPRSVTLLYLFSIVNLMALLNFALVDADLIVLNRFNKTMQELTDLPAAFGASIPEEGMWGHVKLAHPEDACRPLKPPSKASNSSERWIALIARKGCDFGLKVLHAQNAGFDAAIVHNVDSDKLLTMHGDEYAENVDIPSVFIGGTDGMWIRKLMYNEEIFSVIIDTRAPLNPNLYLLPFAIVVGVCFVAMVIFMGVKWGMSVHRSQRSRLSRANLNKIPTKKFRKGDPYDCCAICLDDYEEGDKLRILPCAHAYHQKCIDPWLTKNKKTCPLCKKKVIPGDPDTSSEEDSDGEEESDGEATPLLGNSASNGRSRGGNTFGPSEAAGGAYRNRGMTDSDASSSDFTVPGPSHVEVHHTPQLHRGGMADYTALEISSSDTDDELGATGGHPAFNIVEDYFEADGNRKAKKSSPSTLPPLPPPPPAEEEEEELEVRVVGNIQEASSCSDDEPLV